MTTIETQAQVTENHVLNLTVQLPAEIPPGEHRVVVMIEDNHKSNDTPEWLRNWPIHDVGPWPKDLSLRREDICTSDGR